MPNELKKIKEFLCPEPDPKLVRKQKEQERKEMIALAEKVELKERKVVITGIDIPFTHLVSLLIQLAIAAIPAGIVVAIIYAVGSALFLGLISGFGK